MSVLKLYFIFLIALLFTSFSVSALSYYNGNVSVEEIRGYVTIKNTQQAEVSLIYTLKNSAPNANTVSISFPGFPENTKYNISETRGSDLRTTLSPGLTKFLVSFNQTFDSSSRLSLSAGYNLDDKLPIEKVPQQQYTLELKSEELSIISSEPEFSPVGNALYNLIVSNSYAKKLRVDIESKSVMVSATRIVGGYGQVGDIVNITTSVSNIGSGSLSGLTLEDSIFATYFEPVSTGFTQYDTQQIGESLHIYSASLPTLSPGETYSINYSVKVKAMGSPAFTGARILHNGKFLTSTDANEPTIFPLQVAQQINLVDGSKAEASAREELIPTEDDFLNQTSNPGEQAPIFRPEEKETFNQQVKEEGNRDLLFNIIITLFVLIIIGIGYFAWNKYKDEIVESFSGLNLSWPKIGGQNEKEK